MPLENYGVVNARNYPLPNPRRQLYKKYRLEGLSGTAAAVKAGYSQSYAATNRLAKRCGIGIKRSLELKGFTDEFIAQKIVDQSALNDALGHKYFETGLKLIGALTPQAQVNIEKQNILVYLPQPEAPKMPIDTPARPVIDLNPEIAE